MDYLAICALSINPIGRGREGESHGEVILDPAMHIEPSPFATRWERARFRLARVRFARVWFARVRFARIWFARVWLARVRLARVWCWLFAKHLKAAGTIEVGAGDAVQSGCEVACIVYRVSPSILLHPSDGHLMETFW